MKNNRPKILLAEDDHNLGILLTDLLKAEGYDVVLCKDGESAVKSFQSKSFEICLVDVMLPRMDGFSVVKEIRTKDAKIPVIFISAKSLKGDKLKGYGVGADDYVTKPFDEDELLWKIKAMVRKNLHASIRHEENIFIGKYSFNHSNQSLSLGNNTKRMTEREADILKYLSDRRNDVVKREDLLKDLWGENDYFLGRSLDVFITKIRKYLKEDSNVGIENVFGVGFILNVCE